MCGISCFISKNKKQKKFNNKKRNCNNKQKNYIKKYFDNIQHRGPDNSRSEYYQTEEYSVSFIFHRLAINDTRTIANQPLHLSTNNGHFILICNGEIYNSEKIKNKFEFKTNSLSDCEVILHLYNYQFDTNEEIPIEMKMKNVIKELDGVFAFILFDVTRNQIFSTRDTPIGIRPLFMNVSKKCVSFSSELKGINYKRNISKQVKPGTLVQVDLNKINEDEEISSCIKEWTYTNCEVIFPEIFNTSLYSLLYSAVEKRLKSNRPVGALLSGGLDSSIICYIANDIMKKQGKKLKTFSIGILDESGKINSKDTEFAERFAKEIGTEHTTVTMTFDEAYNSIPDVIYFTETYDITTIRASVPMYIISKYISEHTDIKVVLSGEGSDELFGGYLYFNYAKSAQDFRQETYRLLEELHLYDVLRADRTTAAHGLELRVPFLDFNVIRKVKSLTNDEIFVPEKQEKFYLRSEFCHVLPDYIVSRQKDAFSDAVGHSWVDRLKETIQEEFGISEKKYYLSVFEKFRYPRHIIPGYWLPKWGTSEDNEEPSARILQNYEKN